VNRNRSSFASKLSSYVTNSTEALIPIEVNSSRFNERSISPGNEDVIVEKVSVAICDLKTIYPLAFLPKIANTRHDTGTVPVGCAGKASPNTLLT